MEASFPSSVLSLLIVAWAKFTGPWTFGKIPVISPWGPLIMSQRFFYCKGLFIFFIFFFFFFQVTLFVSQRVFSNSWKYAPFGESEFLSWNKPLLSGFTLWYILSKVVPSSLISKVKLNLELCVAWSSGLQLWVCIQTLCLLLLISRF